MPLYGWLALIALVASEWALFRGVGIIGDFFYLFVWWPYIFLLDAIIKVRKGQSPLSSSPRCFINCSIWSVTFWLIFEIINIRLGNWHYLNLPSSQVIRWCGYSLSFATVLPGIFLTSTLLKDLLARGENGIEDSRSRQKVRIAIVPWMVMGLLFLALPMAWPKYFFPLVWGFSSFLLDPLNGRLGGRSLIHGYLNGHGRGDVYALLGGGLICGLLWEFWNFWAGAKWYYTVPFVGEWKLFEMPLLGFLGFPPFALECFAMYEFVSVMGWGCGDPLSFPYGSNRCSNSPIFLILSFFFWAMAFYLIDGHTVVSFKPMP